MNEENRKELLTQNIISKELTSIIVKNIFIRIGYAILFTLLVWLYAILFRQEGARTDEFAQLGVSMFNLMGTVFIIVVFACYVYLIYSICKLAVYLFRVMKNKYEIVLDKLVYSEKDGGHKINITEYELEYQPDHRIPFVLLHPKFAMYFSKKAHYLFRLQFAKHKNFYIPEGKLYRWSEKYKMEHWAVYRWAAIGDEFYLITVDDKILYVYNTKHFELKD